MLLWARCEEGEDAKRRARLPASHNLCALVDRRLPGKENSKGTRPVHLIITMIR